MISLVNAGTSLRRMASPESTNWVTTVIGSATTPRCAGRFHPILVGSASTWITVAEVPTFSSYEVRKSQSTPKASTTSAPAIACERA